jgi:hypothetical protein
VFPTKHDSCCSFDAVIHTVTVHSTKPLRNDKPIYDGLTAVVIIVKLSFCN